MTLEDFFTLTEMKEGLTAPARVQELITVMQKDKNCGVDNFGDETRQWSTVANAVAATENKDCLDLFIQLDGLSFVDRWLKDAQKLGDHTGEKEESIIALLRALEKLNIDSQKSVSSGICMTVKNLLGHNSSRVQDKARVLFDSWKQDRDSDTIAQDFEKVEKLCDGPMNICTDHAVECGLPENLSRDISPSSGCVNDKKDNELSGDEMLPAVCSVAPQPASDDDTQIHTSDKTLDLASKGDSCPDLVVSPDTSKFVKDNKEDRELSGDEMIPVVCSVALQPASGDDTQIQTSDKTLDYGSKGGSPPDLVGSSETSKLGKENPTIKGDPILEGLESNTVLGTCGTVVPEVGTVEGQLDVSKSNEGSRGNQVQKNSSDNLGATDVSSVSDPLEHGVLSSSADATNVLLESLTKPEFEKDTNANVDASEGKQGISNSESPNHPKDTVLKIINQGGDCNTSKFPNSAGSECLGEPDGPKTYFSSMKDVGAVDEGKDHASDEAEDDSTSDSMFINPAVDARDLNMIKKRSDIELDYGIDPLEVARQVAMEVEREVGDCKTPSCSSSEKLPGIGIRRPDSPDSTNGKSIQLSDGPPKKVRSEPNVSPRDSPTGEGPFITSAGNLGSSEKEKCIDDMKSTQVNGAAQEQKGDAEKGFSGFDLNQEILFEDMDRPISTPISVVSASRAAAATGLPVAPLQFEGTLGWRGSAATSAFRPASPRRTSEDDRTISTLVTHNGSKQRADFLDFDLNVAEGEDDKTADVIQGKQMSFLASLPLGESSGSSTKRSEKLLQLDLNRVSDGDDVPSDCRNQVRLLQHLNGHHSPSPSSSSSSMQPPLRNIDLNDQPSFFNDSSDNLYFGNPPLNSNAIKSDESVISLMGARVEVAPKGFVPQSSPLPNGRISDPLMDVNLGRPRSMSVLSMPYAHPSVYGYSGLTSGPTMPFSTAMYGTGGPTMPYMVDSRGATVVPQLVGSASALPHPFVQPPFIMNMNGRPGPSSSSGVGSSRHSFDLNSGLMIEEGSIDMLGGGLRLFNPGHGRSMDEHLSGVSSQPSSSSGVGVKRQEPDSGWDTYPFNYKHHQPPRK